MIAIDLYRARIGLFQFCGRSSNKCIFNHVIVICTMLSCGLLCWLIVLILLSGDVERNPGPLNLIHGILLNTRSVKSVNHTRNKLVELQSIVALREAKLICLTETWLSDDVLDTEILPSDQFYIYRKDRNSHGGGVLIGVHQSILSRTRQDLVPSVTANIDITAVELLFAKEPKTLLLCIYNPPGHSQTNPAIFIDNI